MYYSLIKFKTAPIKCKDPVTKIINSSSSYVRFKYSNTSAMQENTVDLFCDVKADQYSSFSWQQFALSLVFTKSDNKNTI